MHLSREACQSQAELAEPLDALTQRAKSRRVQQTVDLPNPEGFPWQRFVYNNAAWRIVLHPLKMHTRSPGGSGMLAYLQLSCTCASMCSYVASLWQCICHALFEDVRSTGMEEHMTKFPHRQKSLERTRMTMSSRINRMLKPDRGSTATSRMGSVTTGLADVAALEHLEENSDTEDAARHSAERVVRSSAPIRPWRELKYLRESGAQSDDAALHQLDWLPQQYVHVAPAIVHRTPLYVSDSRFASNCRHRHMRCDECGKWCRGNLKGAFWCKSSMPPVSEREAAWQEGRWDARWSCGECWIIWLRYPRGEPQASCDDHHRRQLSHRLDDVFEGDV